MKALENKREKQEGFPEMSMRQRADIRARKRKKQLRLRWIIMNSIIALCIILGVLVVKAISLNRENTRKEAAKEAAAEKKKNAAKQTPVPTATPTPAPVGSERWLRKDLDPSKPMIAMTFDDGPSSNVTPMVLDTLKAENIKATFFLLGSRVELSPEIVKIEEEIVVKPGERIPLDGEVIEGISMFLYGNKGRGRYRRL